MAYYGDDRPKLVDASLITGWILGAVAFVLHYHTTTTQTFNGVAVHYTSIDYVAVVCGPIAAIIGIIGIVRALKAEDRRLLRLALAASVLLLGVFQTVRGVGII